MKPTTFLNFYEGPTVEKIVPSFGEANQGNSYNINVHGKNFKCLTKECNKLLCKFEFSGEKEYIIFKGKFKSAKEIVCPVPKINRALVLKVSISVDGRDFSGDDVSFTFFDPFVLELSPKIISITGKIFIFF